MSSLQRAQKTKTTVLPENNGICRETASTLTLFLLSLLFSSLTKVTIVTPSVHFQIQRTAYCFPELFCNDYIQCMTPGVPPVLHLSILDLIICSDLQSPPYQPFLCWKSADRMNKPYQSTKKAENS